MNIPFTFDGYRTLVGSLLTQGYEVRSFVDVEPNMRHLVLRHDVDQSLQSAARLASLESEAGWRASYFVLLRSEMYNPFAPASVAALEGIIEGGHEIGLHLDSALYDGAFEAIEEGAARECALLESLLGRPVETISFHRPAPGLVPCDRTLAGRQNSYESRFIDEIGYCSDSRGGWHRDHPLENPAVVEGRALQLLTHAIWWDADDSESPREKLDRLVKTRDRTVRDELAANNAVYRKVGDP